MPVRAAHLKAIREAVAAIPRGQVCAYGRVAEVAGLPGRARLVGRVLAELAPGDNLPWYRVVRASGQLAFAPGSRAFQRQSERLAEEGVLIHNNRIDLNRYGWQLTLDQQLWGPPGA